MIKRENEYGIKCLLMCPMFSVIDPGTRDVLSLKATVEFYPGEYLPDYVDAQNLIRQEFERKEKTVEAATDGLIDFFNEYEPDAVKVKMEIINNNTFFHVSVFADSGFGTHTDEEEEPDQDNEEEKEAETENE